MGRWNFTVCQLLSDKYKHWGLKLLSALWILIFEEFEMGVKLVSLIRRKWESFWCLFFFFFLFFSFFFLFSWQFFELSVFLYSYWLSQWFTTTFASICCIILNYNFGFLSRYSLRNFYCFSWLNCKLSPPSFLLQVIKFCKEFSALDRLSLPTHAALTEVGNVIHFI